MTRMHLLNESHAHTVCKPGWHDDGAGLFLHVADDNIAQWVFRPALADGLTHEEVLGDADVINIDNARELAQACHDRLFLRNDPTGAAFRKQEFADVMVSLIGTRLVPTRRAIG